eukprot:GHVL01001862.1.p1 GENE.GHVL01001862.1~~GHVL01001862.1.p1  ORF type:complete len:212 (-),score=44.41 GHVL01001862.1:331-966(-)
MKVIFTSICTALFALSLADPDQVTSSSHAIVKYDQASNSNAVYTLEYDNNGTAVLQVDTEIYSTDGDDLAITTNGRRLQSCSGFGYAAQNNVYDSRVGVIGNVYGEVGIGNIGGGGGIGSNDGPSQQSFQQQQEYAQERSFRGRRRFLQQIGEGSFRVLYDDFECFPPNTQNNVYGSDVGVIGDVDGGVAIGNIGGAGGIGSQFGPSQQNF